MGSATFLQKTSGERQDTRFDLNQDAIDDEAIDMPKRIAKPSFIDARRKSALSIEDVKLIRDMYK